MKLVDANVLVHAVNTDAPHHEASRRWLDAALSGADTVAFSWLALLAFVRLTTEAGLFPQPFTVDEAMDRVDAWLAAPPAVVVEPGPDHGRTVRCLLRDVGVGANLVDDAHLAALAIAHRCDVVSFDNDFDRLGVRRHVPTA
ncbi:MAG: TA system VapC family ribonuclease toxin [Actinomycetota bacterium]|nr:TA system VapC family ribonuclease toxin [Actinomycetota bacterium]